MNIVFRCDASTELGTGHVYRCLTLADAFDKGLNKIAFVVLKHADNLADLIRARGYKCFEIHSTDLSPDMLGETKFEHYPQERDWFLTKNKLTALGFNPDLILVDHYSLSDTWETLAKSVASYVCVIDDLANRKHDCAVLLDQNLGREDTHYEELVDSKTKILAGGNYCLLRNEFAQQKDKAEKYKESSTSISRLFINMGGADHDNASLLLLRAISVFDQLEVTLLLGPLYEHSESLQQFIKAHPALNVTILKNINNVAEVLATQDLAIGASGASSWERMALGIPTMLYSLAPNQEPIARQLEHLACAINMGPITSFSEKKLQSSLSSLINDRVRYLNMVKNNLSAINASGANLVAETIKEHCGI